jgi:exonuclease SbcD
MSFSPTDPALDIRPPIRVLHIGDVHLGVELHGRPLPEKGYGTRVADFLTALDAALDHASQADLVVLPGDIYKNCEPTPTVQREFARRVRRVARETPVVIIPGNHDLPNAWARASSIDIFQVLDLEGVHVLRQPKVTALPTRAGNVLIAPLPHFPRSRLLQQEEARGKSQAEVMDLLRERLSEYVNTMATDVTAERERLGAATPAILMAHGTIQGATLGGYGKGGMLAPEIDLPLSAVRRPEFDYVALAHIHKQQSLPPNDHTGQPPVVYAGSIERVDFGEEGEEKGVVLAEVSRGNTEWRFERLQPRPFVTLRVKAEEDTEDPLAAIKAQIEAQSARFQEAVVRVFYSLPVGQPNLPERELRAALAGASVISSIRRDVPPNTSRTRLESLTTQLSPLDALEEYLRAKPELAAQREGLMERARGLMATVSREELAEADG